MRLRNCRPLPRTAGLTLLHFGTWCRVSEAASSSDGRNFDGKDLEELVRVVQVRTPWALAHTCIRYWQLTGLSLLAMHVCVCKCYTQRSVHRILGPFNSCPGGHYILTAGVLDAAAEQEDYTDVKRLHQVLLMEVCMPSMVASITLESALYNTQLGGFPNPHAGLIDIAICSH